MWTRRHRKSLRARTTALFLAAMSSIAAPPARGADTPVPPAEVLVRPFPAGSAVLAYVPPAGARADDVRAGVLAHAATLGSPSAVARAISMTDGGVRQTAWFKQTGDARERNAWLAARLRVTARPDARLIELAIGAKESDLSPADAATILRDLGTTYLEDVRKRQTQDLMDQTSVLNNLKIKAEVRLKDVNAERRQRAVSLSIEGGLSSANGRALELQSWTARLAESQAELGRAQGERDRLKAAAASGRDAPEVTAAVAADPRVRRLRDAVDDAEIRLAVAKAKAPEPAAAITEAAAHAEAVRRTLERITEETATHVRQSMLDRAGARFDAAREMTESAAKRVESLKQDVAEAAGATTALADLEQERGRLAARLGSVREQLEQIMATASSGSFVDLRWHLPPDGPGR